MRFSSSMKACVSARLAEPARASTARRSGRSIPALRTMRRERPVISATMSVPKRWTIWSSAPWTGAASQALDHAVAAFHGLAALDRLAVAVDRPGREIALAVGEGLVELGRKAVRQVVEDVFARRDVDLDVAPFLGRDLGEAALHQRLAGGDDLDDGGMAGLEIALDRGDQRRGLHRRDEMVEEALLGALEGGARGRLGLAVQRAGRRR